MCAPVGGARPCARLLSGAHGSAGGAQLRFGAPGRLQLAPTLYASSMLSPQASSGARCLQEPAKMQTVALFGSQGTKASCRDATNA